MTQLRLILRGLTFHARSHAGALLGAAIGSAVLVGALAVGDSVRASLREMALARLGKTDLALASNDRFFRQGLAEELETSLSQHHLGTNAAGAQPFRTRADAIVAPVLQLPGTAGTADGSARANHVQVLGVDHRFWELANARSEFNQQTNGFVINETLASQLRVRIGDIVVLRTEKPSQLSRDAPLSPDEESSIAIRQPVRAIVRDDQFGRFSLQANQVPPFNLFLPLQQLQERVELPGRANLLLTGSRSPQPVASDLSPAQSSALLRRHWKLADAELELRELPQSSGIELRSRRVFLDPPVAVTALSVHSNATGVLTYLVNELRTDDRSTPYSMVTAMGAPVVPPEMKDDEILINEWLAEDLQAKPGDELTLTYFVVRAMRKPEEATARFRVRSIVPLSGAAADPTLMPDFPGLTDAENCRDWDTGFAIDTAKVREKDERYWDQHRGTPKAFVTLAAGQKLWSNRFGDLTAVRFPPGTSMDSVAAAIQADLDPASVGLLFQPVRKQALESSNPAQDFGQLFLGFSFFLVVAALLLTSMMFQLGLEQRTHEIGTLLALGFTARQVRRMLLGEGIGIAVLGGIVGVAGGILYARAMLYGLSTIWRDAVGTSNLQYHASVVPLLIGATAGIAIATFTLWLSLRRQAKQAAHVLLTEGTEETQWYRSRAHWKRSPALGIGIGALAAAVALAGIALVRDDSAAAGLFFGAGALMLAGGIALASSFLGALAAAGKTPIRGSYAAELPTLGELGIRNSARRRKRSLATIGLLACGSFLIAAIGVFRLDANADATQRPSGTGGFALIGESSLPIVHDLNSSEGRDYFGIDDDAMDEVGVVPLRVRDGEDASCLNLNRAQRPRLLGVRPELLHERGAFTFTKFDVDPKDAPWLLLKHDGTDDAVPAIADAASIQWALRKKVGDTIDYIDERGRPFKVRLVAAVANSILQGNLVIDEAEFIKRFPSEAGYRMFLIDAPSNDIDNTSAALTRALQDFGLEMTPTARRLAAFNAVQNTYLSTFQVLGALGLLLGSAGLAVVVLRNVLERRHELAVMAAVGFRRRSLQHIVLAEHAALLLLGLGLGAAAALVAVLPSILTPGMSVPYGSLSVTLGAVLLVGLICTWGATRLALRGQLIDALRNN